MATPATSDTERMGPEQVIEATDSDLEMLGMKATGDILAVRSFAKKCVHGDREERRDELKRGLLQSICSTDGGKKKAKAVTSFKSSGKEKEKTRSVSVGWMHYSSKENRYVSVRLARGGGSRNLAIVPSSNAFQIKQHMKKLFFPDGKSLLGLEEDMYFHIGNFKGNIILDQQFTLAKYINENKLSRIRLYLLSRRFDETDSESDLDSVDGIIASSSSESAPTVPPTLDDNTLLAIPSTEPVGGEGSYRSDSLIGSSIERSAIREEQDKEYFESLSIDQEKEKISKRKKALQAARAARQPPVPSVESESVSVSVQHVTLGKLSRTFDRANRISAVYDWVGSLSSEPEHFVLSTHAVKHLSPTLPVVFADKATLYMTVEDTSPYFPEKILNFKGFSGLDENLDDTIPSSLELPDVLLQDEVVDMSNSVGDVQALHTEGEDSWASVPAVSLAGCTGSSSAELPGGWSTGVLESSSTGRPEDSSVSLPEGSSTGVLEGSSTGLPEGSSTGVRMPSAVNIKVLRIRRSLVMRDLIEEFADDAIMSTRIRVVMVNERGQDEAGMDTGGVFRDAIGCFWQEFFMSCATGENERVPVLRHDFQNREWAAIARILAKGFIELQYFPCMLSKAFMINVIFGEKSVTEDVLENSFKRYIAKDEEKVVAEALKGNLGGRKDDDEEEDEEGEEDDLLSLLSRFDCRRSVTESNVKNIIIEIAHKELIQKAKYIADPWRVVLQRHIRGRLPTISSLLDVYRKVEPTNKKVLALLVASPINLAQHESLEYLKRFVRGLDAEKSRAFLRFITGTDVICVDSIKVMFTLLEGFTRRPIAHICGSVLELPSTYSTFPELRVEFTNVLEKPKWENDIL